MEDKQIGIMVLIFAVGLLVGGLSQPFDGVTGQATKVRETTVSVSPSSVNPGEEISISITPGNKGTERYVYIYTLSEDNSLRVRRAVTNRFCAHTNTCKEPTTITYRIPASFSPGNYGATVKDVATGKQVWGKFNVANAMPPKGFT